MNAGKALVFESLSAPPGLRIVEATGPVEGADFFGVEGTIFVAAEPAAHRANMSRLTQWAAAGRLASHIHAVHELADFKAAFASMREWLSSGEALLRFHRSLMSEE